MSEPTGVRTWSEQIDAVLRARPVPWRTLEEWELVAVIEWADRTGRVGHLKAARAALRRREGLGR